MLARSSCSEWSTDNGWPIATLLYVFCLLVAFGGVPLADREASGWARSSRRGSGARRAVVTEAGFGTVRRVALGSLRDSLR